MEAASFTGPTDHERGPREFRRFYCHSGTPTADPGSSVEHRQRGSCGQPQARVTSAAGQIGCPSPEDPVPGRVGKGPTSASVPAGAPALVLQMGLVLALLCGAPGVVCQPGTDLPLGSLWTRLVANESAAAKKSAASCQGSCTCSSEDMEWRWHGTEEEVFLRHAAFPGAEKCGTWPEEYAALHRKIRSQGPAGKYLSFEPTRRDVGLGDRLNGIVTVFLAALVSGRAFLMNDSFLEAAFEPAEINWRAPEGVTFERTTASMADAMQSPKDAVLFVNGAGTAHGAFVHAPKGSGVPHNLVEQFEGTEEIPHIIIAAQWGLLLQIFTRRDREKERTFQLLYGKGMRVTNGFGCILRFLFRPRMEVFEAAQPALAVLQKQKRGQPRIAIHIRTSDKLAWSALDHGTNQTLLKYKGAVMDRIKIMAGCAEANEDWWYLPPDKVTWFVMSDSAFVRSTLVDAYPNKVVTSGMEALHALVAGNEAAISTVVDWLLFSMCDYYIITASGLSKTAYAYNGRFPPMWMFPRINAGARPCNPAVPNSIDTLRFWSGF